MSTTNNGGPAFPAGSVRKTRSASELGAPFVLTELVEPKWPGMTMRDYFAAKAMQGLLSRDDAPDLSYESRLAYQMADAMLAAREGRAGGEA